MSFRTVLGTLKTANCRARSGNSALSTISADNARRFDGHPMREAHDQGAIRARRHHENPDPDVLLQGLEGRASGLAEIRGPARGVDQGFDEAPVFVTRGDAVETNPRRRPRGGDALLPLISRASGSAACDQDRGDLVDAEFVREVFPGLEVIDAKRNLIRKRGRFLQKLTGFPAEWTFFGGRAVRRDEGACFPGEEMDRDGPC